MDESCFEIVFYGPNIISFGIEDELDEKIHRLFGHVSEDEDNDVMIHVVVESHRVSYNTIITIIDLPRGIRIHILVARIMGILRQNMKCVLLLVLGRPKYLFGNMRLDTDLRIVISIMIRVG